MRDLSVFNSNINTQCLTCRGAIKAGDDYFGEGDNEGDHYHNTLECRPIVKPKINWNEVGPDLLEALKDAHDEIVELIENGVSDYKDTEKIALRCMRAINEAEGRE